ncbi:c-type cytochrome [Aliibacillus thermotolerans]|uniref:C-type cytochrome n=1 Tax=Aliibacillus thermotolerans TaxID=1834418 RepID=A0ABW0U8B3_9BACI|nr:cytochrome c [Aliibacillus thermotolerans]MDA3130725.1 c-type cytochrome [Aliibacillus thermotolerans]
MKGKPLIPFFLIAMLGLMLTLGLSLIGVYQQADDGEEDPASMDPVEYGEELVNSNCISCHGENLEGASGPAIADVGSRLSEEEIIDISVNGIGSMPAGIANPEEAQAIAQYLLSLEE